MKTVEELKQAAKDKNISFWEVHDCSMCGYKCGYVIRGEEVFYDAGCNCTYGGSLEPRSWQDLVNAYNMNAGATDVEKRMAEHDGFKKYVEETRAFWGFVN